MPRLQRQDVIRPREEESADTMDNVVEHLPDESDWSNHSDSLDNLNENTERIVQINNNEIEFNITMSEEADHRRGRSDIELDEEEWFRIRFSDNDMEELDEEKEAFIEAFGEWNIELIRHMAMYSIGGLCLNSCTYCNNEMYGSDWWRRGARTIRRIRGREMYE